MEELVSRRVEVYYIDDKNNFVYEGTVKCVSNNLVYLESVVSNNSNREMVSDQVINTFCSTFLRFEIVELGF